MVLCVLKAHQEELQMAQVLEMEEYGESHEKSAAWEQNGATMRMSYVVVCEYGENIKTIYRVDHSRREVRWTCWENSRVERRQQLSRIEVFVRGEVERKKRTKL